MHQLQDEHHRTVASLQQQLDMMENQVYRIQNEQQQAFQQQRSQGLARTGMDLKEGIQDAALARPTLEEREQGEVRLYHTINSRQNLERCRGRVDKSTELELLCFCSAGYGFESCDTCVPEHNTLPLKAVDTIGIYLN